MFLFPFNSSYLGEVGTGGKKGYRFLIPLSNLEKLVCFDPAKGIEVEQFIADVSTEIMVQVVIHLQRGFLLDHEGKLRAPPSYNGQKPNDPWIFVNGKTREMNSLSEALEINNSFDALSEEQIMDNFSAEGLMNLFELAEGYGSVAVPTTVLAGDAYVRRSKLECAFDGAQREGWRKRFRTVFEIKKERSSKIPLLAYRGRDNLPRGTLASWASKDKCPVENTTAAHKCRVFYKSVLACLESREKGENEEYPTLDPELMSDMVATAAVFTGVLYGSSPTRCLMLKLFKTDPLVLTYKRYLKEINLIPNLTLLIDHVEDPQLYPVSPHFYKKDFFSPYLHQMLSDKTEKVAESQKQMHDPEFQELFRSQGFFDFSFDWSAFNTFTDGIKAFFSSLFDVFAGVLANLKNEMVSYFNRLRDMLVTCLADLFGDVVNKYITSVKMSLMEFFTKFKPILIIVFLLGMVSSGVITYSYYNLVASSFSIGREGFISQDFVSQDSTSYALPTALAAILGVLLPGIGISDMSHIMKYSKFLASVVSAGSNFKKMSDGLLYLLPETVQHALKWACSSETERKTIQFEEWLRNATTLNEMSILPGIMVNDNFRSRLKACLDEWPSVQEYAPNLNLVKWGAQLSMQMMKMVQTALLHESSNQCRMVPWAIHIFGAPGVGKTTCSTKLVEHLGVGSIYHRTTDQYWSGYMGQKAIIIDEFCMTKDSREIHSAEYLPLVSSNQFKPNMASMENVLIGTKGSTCEPSIVLTLSNTGWPKPHNMQDANLAMWGRRRLVADFQIRPGTPMSDSRNVDVSGFSDEQIRDMDWIDVYLKPNIPSATHTEIGPLTWTEFKEYCRQDFEMFKEINGRFGHYDNTMDIDKIFASTFSRVTRTPLRKPEESDLLPLIGSYISGGMASVRNFLATNFQSVYHKKIHFESQGKKYKPKSRPANGFQTARSGSESDNSNQENAISIPDVPVDIDDHSEYKLSEFDESVPELLTFNEVVDLLPRPMTGAEFSQYMNHWADECGNIRREGFICFRDRYFPIDNPLFDRKAMVLNRIRIILGSRLSRIEEMMFESWYSTTQDKRDPISVLADQFSQRILNSRSAFQAARTCSKRVFKILNPFYLLSASVTGCVALTGLSKQAQETLSQTLLGMVFTYLILALVVIILNFFAARSTKAKAKKKMKSQDESPGNSEDVPNKRKSRTPRSYQKLGDNLHSQSLNYSGFSWDEINFAHCVKVCGRTFMSHSHFFYDNNGISRKDFPLILRDSNGKVYKIGTSDYKVVTVRGSDVAFVTVFDKSVQEGKNISNLFVTDAQVERMSNFQGVMTVGSVRKHASFEYVQDFSFSHGRARMTLDECWRGNYQGEGGDCGALLQITSGTLSGKYCGLHVAGAEGLPQSICSIVTKETILDAVNDKDFVSQGFDPNDISTGPNLVSVVKGPYMHVPRKSKLLKTALSNRLTERGFPPTKFPAVLSSNDPRGNGTEPILNILSNVANVVHNASVDKALLEFVKQQTLSSLRRNLDWCAGKEQLSIYQAVQGIKGLNSVKCNTSSGEPLSSMTSVPGKRNWIKPDWSGILWPTEEFEEMVGRYISFMEDGVIDDDAVFVGYEKDELLKPAKIEINKTRAIFCNDLRMLVAARMKYGALIAAFANSEMIASKIGYNQYSQDLQTIYNYMTGRDMTHPIGDNDRFVAGDYGNFDMRHVPEVQEAAYEIFCAIASSELGVSDSFNRVFVQHERFAPIAFGDLRAQFKCFHRSGLCLTTIINNIVNEIYLRYAFQRLNPSLVFDEFVRIAVAGDDHIVNSKPGCSFSGRDIKQVLETEFDQIYTSDTKEEDPGEYRRFEDITFLGATVNKLGDGTYVGCPKLDSVLNCLHFTKSEYYLPCVARESMNLFTLIDDEKTYRMFSQAVTNSCADCGWNVPAPDWISREVIGRRSSHAVPTILSSKFVSQSDPMITGFVRGETVMNSVSGNPSITTLQNGAQDSIQESSRMAYAHKTLNVEEMSLKTGPHSAFYRETVNWSSTHVEGHVLASYQLPFDLLDTGISDPANPPIQNIPFDSFVYWHGDVEVIFQINATAFHQGLLIAYWYPLATKAASEQVDLENTFGCLHTLITPRGNGTFSIRVPYRYPRSVIDTFNRDAFLGTLVLRVVSPIVEADNTTDIGIAVLSVFPDSKFTIPRPTPNPTQSSQVSIVRKPRVLEGLLDQLPKAGEQKLSFGSQGQGGSKTENVQNYNYYGGIAGNVSNQSGSTSGGGDTQEIKASADLKNQEGIMDDKPLVASGGIPVVNQFSGMTKSNGLDVTTSLQLFPAAVSIANKTLHVPHESTISFIMSQKSLVSRIKWNVDTPLDQPLLDIPLSSYLGYFPTDGAGSIPFNLALWNLFTFWRADIVFEFVAVKTAFQSGRLQACIGYGAPSISHSERNKFISHILNFSTETSEDSDVHSIKIPFNAQTEFLHTENFVTSAQGDPVQDNSMGRFTVFPFTPLVVSSNNVANEIEVLVFVRFENVHLAVPNPRPPFAFETGGDITTYVSQGDPSISAVVEDAEGSADSSQDPPAVAATAEETPANNQASNRLNANCLFPYVVRDIHDLCRRGMQISLSNFTQFQSQSGTHPMIAIPLFPNNAFVNFFSGYTGGFKVRIITNSAAPLRVAFIPTNFKKGRETLATHPADRDNDTTLAPLLIQSDGAYANFTNQTSNEVETFVGNQMATELGYPMPASGTLTSGQYYIDVHVPYQSQFPFLSYDAAYTADPKSSATPCSFGYLLVTSSNIDQELNAVYLSMSDEARFMVFRPPRFTKTLNAFNAVNFTLGGIVSTFT